MTERTTPDKTPIDLERTCATILGCAQPTEEGVMGSWIRGYNAGLRAAAQVVRVEAELEQYAVDRGVKRPALLRAVPAAGVAEFADAAYSDWTTAELAYERG